jgi:hypothetical protein
MARQWKPPRLTPTREGLDDGHVSAAARAKRTVSRRLFVFGFLDRRGYVQQFASQRDSVLMR